MNKAIHGIAAFALGAISLSILGAFAFLVFAFPRTVAVWKEQGRQLTAGEQLAVSLSTLGQQYGLLILSFLLLVVIACGVWAVVALCARDSRGATLR